MLLCDASKLILGNCTALLDLCVPCLATQAVWSSFAGPRGDPWLKNLTAFTFHMRLLHVAATASLTYDAADVAAETTAACIGEKLQASLSLLAPE